MVVVEVEAEDTTSEISMPPFIPTSVVTEVTDDRKFSSFHQAQLLQEQQAKAASAAE
jgi:CYTH domain-containing protein